MKDTIFITFNRLGVIGYRKSKPNLRAGEHAVKLIISVADEYFKGAIPEADLRLDETHVLRPAVDVIAARAGGVDAEVTMFEEAAIASGLSSRVRNGMIRRCQVRTLADVAGHTKSYLLRCNGMGPKVVAELERFLKSYGLAFSPEVD